MFITASTPVNRDYLRLPNGTGVWKSDYICADHASVPSPQAYLIEQDPGRAVQSHFHEQPEFQVIVGGYGFLGRNPVRPITVHYAGAYTGYGPVTAGPEGIAYLTLRPMRDIGALWLPEDRPRLKNVPRKHYHSAALTPHTGTIVGHDDGMAAWMFDCAPGETLTAAAPSGGGGQYFVLLTGSAELRDATLTARGYAFASSDEPAVAVRAGTGGAQLLVLQFPRAEYAITYAPDAYRYSHPA